MKGVVVVPCWQRADFLWACLHRLSLADGIGQYRILISIDRKHSVDVQNIAYDFRNTSRLDVHIRHAGDHPYHGNSFNVLTAYREAVKMADRADMPIHLVEEDIFVGKGYLRFHEAAHELDRGCFAVSACRDQNHPPVETTASDPQALVMERSTFQSLGICFRAHVLKSEILPIATDDYFAQPVETLARLFPNTAIPRGQAEQDGLIGRVLEERCRRQGSGMLYPLVPRAFHAGFFGYNRSGGRPLTEGSVEDRGKRLLAMTAAELNALADPSYRDITPVPLDVAEAEPLVLRRMVV